MRQDEPEQSLNPNEDNPTFEKNAADTGLDFGPGQSTTTGTGPGAGSGTLEITAVHTDNGPGLDISDDLPEEAYHKSKDHDLGGQLSDKSREGHP